MESIKTVERNQEVIEAHFLLPDQDNDRQGVSNYSQSSNHHHKIPNDVRIFLELVANIHHSYVLLHVIATSRVIGHCNK